MWFLPFVFLFLAVFTLAQYPPQPVNLTTITSPVDGNITISYKSPPIGACKTVFSTQQQYTGWVNIPGDYATNTFFWFIGAREPTDTLTIWINGGPGSSSMIGLFTENGPCEVHEKALGEFETVAREWGWDRGSNMLYIDQVYNYWRGWGFQETMLTFSSQIKSVSRMMYLRMALSTCSLPVSILLHKLYRIHNLQTLS